MSQTSKAEALSFFSVIYGGAHHIPGNSADGELNLKPFGDGWCIYDAADQSTYDYSQLTRMVFLAHDWCFRLSIHAHTKREVRIAIWKRERVGSMCQRHPTLDGAITEWRRTNPVPDESTP